PAADRAIDELALRFAMTRIVEPDQRTPALVGETRKRRRLGAPHVGLEAAHPEQPGRGAGNRPHRDGAGIATAADIDKFQRLGHRILRFEHRAILTVRWYPDGFVGAIFPAGSIPATSR